MKLEAAIVIAALLGLVLLVAGVRRLWKRRLWSGSSQSLVGLLLLVTAALFAALAVNLHTYNRLTHEKAVADVHFRGLGPQSYQAELRYPSGKTKVFEIRGDEWQLDARILKWHGMANLLGLHTVYRLERLSGRYQRIEEERNSRRSVYALAENAGLDLWSLARRYENWLPWVDAIYGSATYMPMGDGAVFSVTVTTSGLVARPLNEAAREAVQTWR